MSIFNYGNQTEDLGRPLKQEYFSNWSNIVNYLMKEKKEGKIEFRIAFQNDNHFIIHPLGKNGETLDIKL